jgi:hypothetical protein
MMRFADGIPQSAPEDYDKAATHAAASTTMLRPTISAKEHAYTPHATRSGKLIQLGRATVAFAR